MNKLYSFILGCAALSVCFNSFASDSSIAKDQDLLENKIMSEYLERIDLNNKKQELRLYLECELGNKYRKVEYVNRKVNHGDLITYTSVDRYRNYLSELIASHGDKNGVIDLTKHKSTDHHIPLKFKREIYNNIDLGYFIDYAHYETNDNNVIFQGLRLDDEVISIKIPASRLFHADRTKILLNCKPTSTRPVNALSCDNGYVELFKDKAYFYVNLDNGTFDISTTKILATSPKHIVVIEEGYIQTAGMIDECGDKFSLLLNKLMYNLRIN